MAKSKTTKTKPAQLTDEDRGDPSLMLVRMRAGYDRTYSFVRRSGSPVDLTSGVFYLVEDEALLARILTRRSQPRARGAEETERDFEAANPLLFERISQADAIAEELAKKPEGSYPSRLVGSAFKPRRILAPSADTRDRENLAGMVRDALKSAEGTATKLRSVLVAIEQG